MVLKKEGQQRLMQLILIHTNCGPLYGVRVTEKWESAGSPWSKTGESGLPLGS